MISDYWHNFGELYLEAAPYLIIGFVVAGLLHQYLPKDLVKRYLGGSSGGSIFKASLIGTPVPLCSCGVVPVALGLHRDGASKPAVISFLISTPENGVESISLTYTFFGLPFTIARIVFAIVVANLTALAVAIFDNDDCPATPCHSPEPISSCCAPAPEPTSCCSSSQSCPPTAPTEPSSCCAPSESRPNGWEFVLRDFVPSIAGWVLFGFFLSAAIASFLPDDLLSRLDPAWAVPLAGLIGIPMYVCASASTPIAFSLFINGLSPGACLVFLLTGPATNSANIPLYLKSFGARTTAIYYTGIYVASVTLGLALDSFADPRWLLSLPQHSHMHTEFGMFHYLGAALLSVLLAYGVYLKSQGNKTSCCG